MTTTSKEEQSRLLEFITRRQKQIIVHSYLYYKLDESVISDQTFDAWYKELVQLHKDYPEIAKKAPYWKIAKHFDDSGSGFFIKDYPGELIRDALILVYGCDGKKKRVALSRELPQSFYGGCLMDTEKPYSEEDYEKAKSLGYDLDDWNDYVIYYGLGDERE